MNCDYTYKKDLIRFESIDLSTGVYDIYHLTSEEWRAELGVDEGEWNEDARSRYEEYMMAWELAIVEPEDIDLWYIDNVHQVVSRIRPWPDQVSTLVDSSDILEALDRQLKKWLAQTLNARTKREKEKIWRDEALEESRMRYLDMKAEMRGKGDDPDE